MESTNFQEHSLCKFEERKSEILGKLDAQLGTLREKRREFEGMTSQQNNDLIILKEVVFPKIQMFYNGEMEQLTQKPVSSNLLMYDHQKLKEECLESVKNALGYINSDSNHCCRQIQVCLTEMEEILNDCFVLHSQNNRIKIEKDILTSKLIIAKARNNYIDLMSNMIRDQIFSEHELELLHKNCLNQAAIFLKIEMRQFAENVEIHIRNFETQVRSNYEVFFQENLRRTKEEKDREKCRTRKTESGNFDLDVTKLTPPRQLPIIAVEFGYNKVQCGIFSSGMLISIPDQWGNEKFPNSVAITIEDEVLIGHEVINRESSDIKYSSSLTELLLSPSHELFATPKQIISFRGEKIELTKEILCGLILLRIKLYTEAFLNGVADSVVITVPLWYTSSQRQAIKDAGTIAGFSTVNLINETTAAALSFANEKSRIDSQFNCLFIVANNDDRFDAAVYRCNSGKTKMESCTGNLHFRNYLSSSSMKNKVSTVGGSVSIRSLVQDCVNERNITEYAIIFEGDREKLKIIKKIATAYAPEAKDVQKSSVLRGAAIFANLLNDNEKEARLAISDLLPYQIQYKRSNQNGSWSNSPICQHEVLPSTERRYACPFDASEDLQFEVTECGGVKSFLTSKFILPINSISKTNNRARKIQVDFVINCEGILRFAAYYVDILPKEEIKINYSSFYMSQDDMIAQNSLFLSAMIPDTKIEEKRIFENLKGRLERLAQFTMKNLGNVENAVGRDQMDIIASAAIEALANLKITEEDVKNRIKLLTKLNDKYLPFL